MFPLITCTIESLEDHDIIYEFFVKHKTLLYAEARKYLSSQEDVEDIVYEAIVRIIEYIDKFRSLLPNERIRYAKVIVRNLSFIYLKRQSYFTMVSFDDVDPYLSIDDCQLPESQVTRQLQIEQIRNIWAKVPVEDRLLLEQKYVLDWNDADLAKNLGIKPQSVRMRITRAKRNVIRLLMENGFHIYE